MAEQAKAPDNADAYRGLLTHYDAKISLFKEILPYEVWAFGARFKRFEKGSLFCRKVNQVGDRGDAFALHAGGRGH